MEPTTTTALVGATGGAGTTRLTMELAGTLARNGQQVLVLDVAFDTQGLSRYVAEPVTPDITHVLLDEAPIEEARYPVEIPVSGAVTVVPAAAAFERLARAKRVEPARRLEEIVETAQGHYDQVLIDTPPIGSNPAVAAVTTSDTVGIVTPATTWGQDALFMMQGRIDDIGSDWTVAIGTQSDRQLDGLDVVVPELPPLEGTSPTTTDPSATGVQAIDEIAIELQSVKNQQQA